MSSAGARSEPRVVEWRWSSGLGSVGAVLGILFGTGVGYVGFEAAVGDIGPFGWIFVVAGLAVVYNASQYLLNRTHVEIDDAGLDVRIQPLSLTPRRAFTAHEIASVEATAMRAPRGGRIWYVTVILVGGVKRPLSPAASCEDAEAHARDIRAALGRPVQSPPEAVRRPG